MKYNESWDDKYPILPWQQVKEIDLGNATDSDTAPLSVGTAKRLIHTVKAFSDTMYKLLGELHEIRATAKENPDAANAQAIDDQKVCQSCNGNGRSRAMPQLKCSICDGMGKL